MKSFLQDLVAHTHALGFLPLVRIIANDDETLINALSIDRSVVLEAKTKNPVEGLSGSFGMPNLNKLDIHLKCPEYKDNAVITLTYIERNGENIPGGLHFENSTGDFENDYRFMSIEMLNDRMNIRPFKGAEWNFDFMPSLSSIQRLKFQSSANNEEKIFQVKTVNGNLVFSFGSAFVSAGSFVFEPDVKHAIKHNLSWPVDKVLSILSKPGVTNMKISDKQRVMQITVDSGIAEYNYIIPAHHEQ